MGYNYVNVRIEWRRGTNGDQGTYIFSPKPTLRRPSAGKRSVVHVVPLLDGVIVQNLSKGERVIDLTGVLYNKTNSWDDMETLRNNLINGLGIGPGQLHVISPQRHIRYDGQVFPDGIQFEEQERSNVQDYTVQILVPGVSEINVTEPIKTINSNAEII